VITTPLQVTKSQKIAMTKPVTKTGNNSLFEALTLKDWGGQASASQHL